MRSRAGLDQKERRREICGESAHDATEVVEHNIIDKIIAIETIKFPIYKCLLLNFCRRGFAPQTQLAGVHWISFPPAPFFLARVEGQSSYRVS